MNQLKVTLVIPGYKPECFLQTLKSALGQTYENYEIVISDNCPSEQIKDICNNYPRIKYTRNLQTGYKNILDCLYGCDGDYIKPLFDDDILHPFCVERMVKCFEENNLSFVFSASQVIDAENNIIQNRIPFKKNMMLDYRNLTRLMLLNFNNFIGEFSSVMINRNVLKKIHYSDFFTYGDCEFTKGLSDVAAFLNLCEKESSFYISEILSYFRRDDRLNSNSRQDPFSNPNFRFAVTDWIDLLIEAHKKGVVTDSEIIDHEKFVENFINQFVKNYPDVKQHGLIYSNYLKGVRRK
jgi:glycosyltransferase involved in cell wall biosynthesis